MSQQPHMPPPHPGHQYQAGPPPAPRTSGLGTTVLMCGAAGAGGLMVLGVMASVFGLVSTATTGIAAAPTTSPTTSTTPVEPERQSATKPSTTAPAPAKPSKAATPSATAPAPAEPSKAPQPATGIGKPFRDGKFQFTVTKIKAGVRNVGNDFLGKSAQGQYIQISLTVENIGDKPQSLVGDAQKLYDIQGREFSADTEAGIYADSKSFVEEINPGNSVRGVLLFDIPKGAKPARLELHDSYFSGGVEVVLR
jgi:hypothetical protein